jgi:hypothetical protein
MPEPVICAEQSGRECTRTLCNSPHVIVFKILSFDMATYNLVPVISGAEKPIGVKAQDGR